MGKKRIPILSEASIEELTYHYKHGATHVFRQRCHLILLKHAGNSAASIAKLSGYPNVQTIRNWLNRYELLGIDGLKTQPGQGRKTILNVAQHEAQVKAIVQTERQRLEAAKPLIEEKLAVKMSNQTLIRFLKKLEAPTNALEKL